MITQISMNVVLIMVDVSRPVVTLSAATTALVVLDMSWTVTVTIVLVRMIIMQCSAKLQEKAYWIDFYTCTLELLHDLLTQITVASSIESSEDYLAHCSLSFNTTRHGLSNFGKRPKNS